MSDEQRIKRSAKKPAWMTDEMLIDPVDVETDAKTSRPPPKCLNSASDVAQRAPQPQHEVVMQRTCRPSGRMCSNPQCKNPYDSPQWRRGPLGPGTLCNACGTRYARLQAKMNGDKRGKMRPQEMAEWEAFEQQRLLPQHPSWRMHVQHFVQQEQQQQQFYTQQQDDYACLDDSDCGHDERSFSNQQHVAQRPDSQQAYGREGDIPDAEGTEDGQLMCPEGLSDSPDVASRAAIAAVAAAAAVGASRLSSRSVWRNSRQHFPNTDAATDSQEDEAAAYSCQDAHARGDAAAVGSSPAGPSFLHLLAVGEAMIKTEGVAPQDRRAAWTEVVGKGLGPDPERVSTRAPPGESVQGVKRSRFALEAEEQQAGRTACGSEPTALQRALERFGQQQLQKRPKATHSATAGDHSMPPDKFERLLAEAEACVRARSVSPCMLKGMPGAGSSPTCNLSAPRPVTPLQLGANALDVTNNRSMLQRSLLGGGLTAQEGQQGVAGFMLPAATMPRSNQGAPNVSQVRGRHVSLAQALAAAEEANSQDDNGSAEPCTGLQESPASHLDSNAASPGLNRRQLAAGSDASPVEGTQQGPGAQSQTWNHQQGQQSSGPLAMHEHFQAWMSQMCNGASNEPSPNSKMFLSDEVLSPSFDALAAWPCKQARTLGPTEMGVAAVCLTEEPATGDQARADQQALAGDDKQHGQLTMSQHFMAAQDLSQSLLMHPVLLQHTKGSGQQQAGQVPEELAALPTPAGLQQAGHHPVLLACQLVLQQQANPTAFKALFQTPAGTNHGLSTHAAGTDLLSGALHLAQSGNVTNAQTHLDQLKAVTLSAQAAAATASAVAAATELLWRQLQQQERQRLQGQQQPEATQQDPLQQAVPAAADQSEVPAVSVDGRAAADTAAAQPVSSAADPEGARAASGSMSRSSSSSTSAAGLSAEPSRGHSVDKQGSLPVEQPAQQEQQQHCTADTPMHVAVAVSDAADADDRSVTAAGLL